MPVNCADKPQWAVIMSRGSKYIKQVIEMDFQYPSEGIHYNWDKGEPADKATPVACITHGPSIYLNGTPSETPMSQEATSPMHVTVPACL